MKDLITLLLHSGALVGVSVLSVLLWPRLSSLSYTSPFFKWLVVVCLSASWMFAVTASLLSSIAADDTLCASTIFICIAMYTGSKFCVYLFLIERLHLIATKGPRHKNKTYIASALLLVPFLGIMGIMMIFRVSLVHDGACHIGLTKEGALPLVTYDTFFGLFQTSVFAWILCRYLSRQDNNDTQTAILHKALKVAFIGSFLAFVLSFLNILILVINSELHASVCLLLCIADVIGNSCVITYMVRPISIDTNPRSKLTNALHKTENANVATSQAIRAQSDEEYELELQTVAEMLKRMQAQGRREPTTTGATPTELQSSHVYCDASSVGPASHFLEQP